MLSIFLSLDICLYQISMKECTLAMIFNPEITRTIFQNKVLIYA